MAAACRVSAHANIKISGAQFCHAPRVHERVSSLISRLAASSSGRQFASGLQPIELILSDQMAMTAIPGWQTIRLERFGQLGLQY